MRAYVMPLVIAACGAWLSAAASMMSPAESRETIAQIDFDALHSQATMALDSLRHSRDLRLASASTNSK